MEPAVHREQTDTSLYYNPRFGLQRPTAVLRVFNIMVGVMYLYLPAGVMARASGVEEGALWDIRWISCRRRNVLGDKRGSPDALCPIHPLTPFFWFVNVSVTSLAAWRSLAMAVATKTIWPKQKEI